MSRDSSVTATVNSSEASASTTMDTGFADLDGTLAPDQPTAAPYMAADTGEPEEADADLNARVAFLLRDKAVTDWNAVQKFLTNVVPWPTSFNDAGWVNIHYSFPDTHSSQVPPPNILKAGRAYKDISRFMGYVGWGLKNPDRIKDMFFCTSLQRDTRGVTTKGDPKAAKSGPAAMALRSIWVDIDVKPGDPKHYGTEAEALKAILRFSSKVRLPSPSAIVRSGGGLHVYWISTEALTPQGWLPYAQGLKNLLNANTVLADTAITTDAARILRIPGTLNHKPKYPQPMPVELIDLPLNTYDFSSRLTFLHQFAGPAVAPTAAPTRHSIWADDPTVPIGARDTFRKGPLAEFAGLKGEPDLNVGIGRYGASKIDPRPIFKKCGFYREAMRDHGAQNDQPQWNFAILGTTFMESGRVFAHEISKGHDKYTAAETDVMFDRKMAERVDGRISGPPLCSTIRGAGSRACETCPLLGKIKSPINIKPDVTATVNPSDDNTQADPSFVDPYAEFVGPEFPLEILPPTLAAFVDAEHRSMGADPAAIAMAALTTVAGAMHAETQLRVADGWWERPIFWTALVGQPSSMKSPILKKATEPLSRLDHGQSNVWQKQHTAWAQTPNNKTIPSPPKPARSVINDATAEKVAELLSRDPCGSLMVQDELASLLGSFERYNTGSSSRAFYLSAWQGGPFLKDRVGKGPNDPGAEIRVENLALCILGGIQPDRLAKLDDLTSDGLLQRFVSVLMKPAKLGDPYHLVASAEAEYEKLIKSVHALPAQNYHFTDEAFEVRDDVLGYLHKLELVDGFPPSLIGAIGKLKGYFARICLVLHVARHQDTMNKITSPSEPLHPSFKGAAGEHLRIIFGLPLDDCLSAGINTSMAISGDTAEASKKMLLEFLLPHMIGLYDVVVNGGQERDKLQSIANFILAADKDRLRPSDFTAGVRALRGLPEQKIREWVGRFCGMDWLLPVDEKPGVPTKAWLVSPGLRDHFTERRKQVQAARAEMHAILKAGGSRRAS